MCMFAGTWCHSFLGNSNTALPGSLCWHLYLSSAFGEDASKKVNLHFFSVSYFKIPLALKGNTYLQNLDLHHLRIGRPLSQRWNFQKSRHVITFGTHRGHQLQDLNNIWSLGRIRCVLQMSL